jgi:hypothetical protein
MGSLVDVETIEADAVDSELVAEPTAPQRRSAPVVAATGPAAERSRRATLVSPIPSLLAASMRTQMTSAEGEIPVTGGVCLEGFPGEGIPTIAEPQMTSKQGDLSRALLLDGESDYVVEIGEAKSGAQDAAPRPLPEHDPADDTDADP